MTYEIIPALTQVTVLMHPDSSTTLSVTVFALDFATINPGVFRPLWFLHSRRILPQKPNIVYLIGSCWQYIVIEDFCHPVQSRYFVLFINYKPLTYAPHTAFDRYSSREVRYLDYISQFATGLRHIQGGSNWVADTVTWADHWHNVSRSRPFAHGCNPNPEKSYMEAAQLFLTQYQQAPLYTNASTILCDANTELPPKSSIAAHKHHEFHIIHGL